MGGVLGVAEGEHEVVQGFGVLGEAEGCFCCAARPAEVWERWGNEVEGYVGGGLVDCAEEFGCFEVGAGPAVDEEEGDCVGGGGGLVQEVNVERGEVFDLDCCVEVREFVQFGFLFAPGEVLLPVFGQAFDVFQWSTVTPGSILKLLGGQLGLVMEALRCLLHLGRL